MDNLLCFVAVDFEDDEKVSGYAFWYLCMIDGVAEGDKVVAPLGRHDRLQTGVVRQVKLCGEDNAPYPLHSIKYIHQVIKSEAKDV